MIKYEKKILDNGLRVIVAPMENTQAVTLTALIGVGSRYETKNVNGISHFLEHLFFKGTKNRPEPGQIHKELERIGASHNAFTGKEMTGFWVKSAGKDFDISLDIVSDILLEPLFKKEEIEKEKGVILQEIAMYEDMPQRKVWDSLEELFFGDQPMGWNIAGSRESVVDIKQDDIVNYRLNNYLSENMIVVVAGNIKPKAVFEKVDKHFNKVKTGKNEKALKAEITQKESRIKLIKKDTDQTHLAMALKAYDIHDERKYALNVLSIILGGGFSSRLFMEIREKLGLAYYVLASDNLSDDVGYVGIGAGVSHDKLEITVEKINQILNSLAEKGVIKEELEFAKSLIRGKIAISLETSDEIADFCAFGELYHNKIIQPEEELKKIEKVSQSDILKIAREIFIPSKVNLAVIGPHNETICKKLIQ